MVWKGLRERRKAPRVQEMQRDTREAVFGVRRVCLDPDALRMRAPARPGKVTVEQGREKPSCASSASEETVGRGLDASRTAVQDMRVDHRRGDVLVAEQFLHSADVATVLEEVRGEGMAEGVAGRTLGDARCEDRSAHRVLHDGFVQVVAALLTGCGLDVVPGGGEDPLPGPLAAGVGLQEPRILAWREHSATVVTRHDSDFAIDERLWKPQQ